MLIESVAIFLKGLEVLKKRSTSLLGLTIFMCTVIVLQASESAGEQLSQGLQKSLINLIDATGENVWTCLRDVLKEEALYDKKKI